MVQILPPVDTFESEFGRNIGQGFGRGVSQASDFAMKIAEENFKRQQRQKLISDIEGPSSQKSSLSKQLTDSIPAIEEKLGFKLTEDQIRSISDQLQQGESPTSQISEPQEDPFLKAKKYAAIGEHDLASIAGKEAESRVKMSQKEKQEKRRQFESDREFHTKVSAPIVEEAQQVLKNTPITKSLISQQRRDISSGNTSGLIPFLVDKFGLEAYRDPESARFKTASKQRFVESLHELGGSQARPNQFIEQQLTAAQPALGRSEEANLGVLDLEDFVLDMKNERAKIISQLAQEDYEKDGFERKDIGMRAEKLMQGYAEKRQDEMAYDLRKRHEENLPDEELVKEIVSGSITPDTPLTIRAARILMIKNNDDEKKATAEAKRLGFKIPLESTYQRGL